MCACCGDLFFKRSFNAHDPSTIGDDKFREKFLNDYLKTGDEYLACWTCRDNKMNGKEPTIALKND